MLAPHRFLEHFFIFRSIFLVLLNHWLELAHALSHALAILKPGKLVLLSVFKLAFLPVGSILSQAALSHFSVMLLLCRGLPARLVFKWGEVTSLVSSFSQGTSRLLLGSQGL